MNEIEIWNRLCDLTPEEAYQFYLMHVYADPSTGENLRPHEIYEEKLGISKTAYYEQRSRIYRALGTSNIGDEHIRVMGLMAGLEPKPLPDPPRLADWPPDKKDPPQEQPTEAATPPPAAFSNATRLG